MAGKVLRRLDPISPAQADPPTTIFVPGAASLIFFTKYKELVSWP
jgi:hypothetical protein